MPVKIYAPSIQNTLQAFQLNREIQIPFAMNRASSTEEIGGFKVLFKSVNSGDIILSYRKYFTNTEKNDYLSFSNTGEYGVLKVPAINSLKEIYEAQEEGAEDVSKAWVSAPPSNILEGVFYKIQFCFLSKTNEVNFNNLEGYYSTAAITKCCIENIYIDIPEQEGLFYNTTSTLYGTYQSRDLMEKISTFQFVLFDKDLNQIYDSKEQVYNNNNNVLNIVKDDEEAYQVISASISYQIDTPINMQQVKYQKLFVITTNGLSLETDYIPYFSQIFLPIRQFLYPKAIVDMDNGLIRIFSNNENRADGYFLLSRASNDTGYTVWQPLYRFCLRDGQGFSFQDVTIEAGKIYRYAVQQFNLHGYYAEREIAENAGVQYDKDGKLAKEINIYASFEDIFLSDGNKQLRIRFNPKVSSFKNVILESKTDTIGNRTPFFFRNGVVKYKELPLSGLISCLMDDQQLFATVGETDADILFSPFSENIASNDFGKNEWIYTHNLTEDNISVELQFKLQVLDWLTNGKPKLFRSPYEGSYIVRLMNVSLSPQDTLGRMLHTFSATGYEIMDYNYQNLLNNNLVFGENVQSQEEFEVLYVDKMQTFNFDDFSFQYLYPEGSPSISHTGFNIRLELNNTKKIKELMLVGLPGTSIQLDSNPEDKYVIGQSGTLAVSINKQLSHINLGKDGQFIFLSKTEYPLDFLQSFQMTILFQEKFVDKTYFNSIDKVDYTSVFLETLPGNAEDKEDYSNNILSTMLTPQNSSTYYRFFYLGIFPKTNIEINEEDYEGFSGAENYVYNVNFLNSSEFETFSWKINQNLGKENIVIRREGSPCNWMAYGYDKTIEGEEKKLLSFQINDDGFEVFDTEGFLLYDLYLGDGVIANISYEILKEYHDTSETPGILGGS